MSSFYNDLCLSSPSRGEGAYCPKCPVLLLQQKLLDSDCWSFYPLKGQSRTFLSLSTRLPPLLPKPSSLLFPKLRARVGLVKKRNPIFSQEVLSKQLWSVCLREQPFRAHFLFVKPEGTQSGNSRLRKEMNTFNHGKMKMGVPHIPGWTTSKEAGLGCPPRLLGGVGVLNPAPYSSGELAKTTDHSRGVCCQGHALPSMC